MSTESNTIHESAEEEFGIVAVRPHEPGDVEQHLTLRELKTGRRIPVSMSRINYIRDQWMLQDRSHSVIVQGIFELSPDRRQLLGITHAAVRPGPELTKRKRRSASAELELPQEPPGEARTQSNRPGLCP